MRTRDQAAEDRKELWRSIRQDEKQKAKAKVLSLSGQLREARARRKRALADAKAICRAERVAASERAKAIRAEAKIAAQAERLNARSSCAANLGQAQATKADIEKARGELQGEKKFQADMRRIESGNRKRQAPKASKRELASESDDEVRQNIPADLIPLFERVRRSIKGSARMSRTEAFLHYAEEHPGEVLEVLEDKTDALIRELEERQRSGEEDDPGDEMPKSVKAKLATIERSIDKLAASDLDGQARFKEQQAIQRAIDRFERFASITEGYDVAELARTLWKGAIEARENAERNYTGHLSAEAARLRREDRAEQAAPGTYKHELALMRNPALTTLGKLTRIRWKGGSRAWSLATAPTLAYDGRGKLVIVYGARLAGKASAAERKEYERTHWGEAGDGKAWTGVVANAPLRKLGVGLSITYTTRKGSRELVDWEHEWGEGARGKWTPPDVVEHVCGAARCQGHRAIALRGGSYVVNTRGIVG